MAQNEATIPAESLAGLDVREGDTLTVKRTNQESITLVTRIRHVSSRMTGRQFIQKWGGAFDLATLEQKAQDDPRLAHLINKHVT